MRSDAYAAFSVHILEDEDGNVRIVSDWTGRGQRCLDLGLEIMESLADLQPYTDGQLRFVLPSRTDLEH
jgi:hypothetical protein